MKKLQFLIIGAHPDDPDGSCGGLALKMRKKGHDVTLISATDGGAGHHQMERKALVERRREESRQSGLKLDCPYIVMDIPDGELTPSLENRAKLIEHIRRINPDVIITHRTCDYHPDHRGTGQLVMDCSYLMGVPLYCPQFPAMRKTPVILSAYDDFTKPTPFEAHICVPIDDELEGRTEAMLCHESQYFEWLPWVGHWTNMDNAPTLEAKKEIMRERERREAAGIAEKYRHMLPEGTKYAEAYEVTEYGARLTEEIIREMTE